jgi:hypothetical protein
MSQAILEAGRARAERGGVPAETLRLEGIPARLSDVVASQAGAWAPTSS